ncbi:MAG: hypothetical protein K9N49_10755, partial [Candidatus Marinimicrobia bacterium]|nr:hypothetical protein [Candidatus Neomarinimicrobiota bacterium]
MTGRSSGPGPRLLAVGLGAGGTRLAARLAAEDDLPAVALHTDALALEQAAVPHKLLLGPDVCRGQSTGGDMTLARRATRQSAEPLRELLEGQDLVFLVCALGGGTGGGVAPLVAQTVRACGGLSLAIVTLPFEFEGGQKMALAREGLAALQEEADAVIVMPNEKLQAAVGNQGGMLASFEAADALLVNCLRALWALIRHAGPLALDFADLRSLILRGPGLCAIAYGEAAGPDRVTQAVERAFALSVAEGADRLATDSGLIAGILGGNDLTLQ